MTIMLFILAMLVTSYITIIVVMIGVHGGHDLGKLEYSRYWWYIPLILAVILLWILVLYHSPLVLIYN